MMTRMGLSRPYKLEPQHRLFAERQAHERRSIQRSLLRIDLSPVGASRDIRGSNSRSLAAMDRKGVSTPTTWSGWRRDARPACATEWWLSALLPGVKRERMEPLRPEPRRGAIAP
jgi:hypothetical protein